MEEGGGMQAHQAAGTLGCGLEWVLGWEFWDEVSTRMKEHQDQGRYPGMHWAAGTLGQEGITGCGASGWGGFWDAGECGWGSTRLEKHQDKLACTTLVAKTADGMAGAGHRAGLCGVGCGVRDPVSTMWCPAASQGATGSAQRAANTKDTDLTGFFSSLLSCPSTQEGGSSPPLPTHAQSTCHSWAGFAQESLEDEGCPTWAICRGYADSKV